MTTQTFKILEQSARELEAELGIKEFEHELLIKDMRYYTSRLRRLLIYKYSRNLPTVVVAQMFEMPIRRIEEIISVMEKQKQ